MTDRENSIYYILVTTENKLLQTLLKLDEHHKSLAILWA